MKHGHKVIPGHYDDDVSYLTLALEVALIGKYFLVTVKFLNFLTPENFVVIYLKFKQRSQAFGYFIKKMQME